MNVLNLVLSIVAALLAAVAYGAWRSTDRIFDALIESTRRMGKESEERATMLRSDIATINARIKKLDDLVVVNISANRLVVVPDDGDDEIVKETTI